MRALIALLLLAACVTGPQTVRDEAVGAVLVQSREVASGTGGFEELRLRAVVLRKDGARLHGLAIRHRAHGDPVARFFGAYSGGDRLGYARGTVHRLGCRGGVCGHVETGTVVLTRPQMRAAARDGLAFTLVGRRERVAGHAPAALFAEALGLADE